jgi:hypothetical protein
MGCTPFAQNKDRWRIFVKRVIKLRILLNAGHLLARRFTAIVSKRAMF